MKKLLFFLTFILSCSPEDSDIRYFKDKRTNICFAYSCWACNSAKMTEVPCYKVEHLLDK